LSHQGAKQVNNSNFNHSIGLCIVTALLAGCSGAQAPLVTTGLPPLVEEHVRPPSAVSIIHAPRRAPQRAGYKVTGPLLYVTNYTAAYNDVRVYRAKAKDPTPLATISDGIDTPSGACIDGRGTLYVTNDPASGPGWISEYSLGKTVPSKVISSGASTPAFCAIDANGNLWVTNLGLDDVAEYLKGASKPHSVITNGLVFPVGIAIDHSGNLYVANGWDASQQNVQVYSPGSKSPSRTITDGVTWPVGITVDLNGTLYVTNAAQNNVEEYLSGQDNPFQTITKAMNHPVDVTVNKKGYLYVTDMGSSTVVEFPSGSLTPSTRQVSEGLYDPEGAAYYPAFSP
jgi:sugar lactone lactonase YvrE